MPFRSASRPVTVLLIGAAVAASALSLGAPAQAAPDCVSSVPYTEFEGTSMELVYAAQAPVGGAAAIDIPDLCVPGSAVVTELSNDEGVTVDVVGDGSFAAGVTLTAPTVDFEGIARVDLQVVDGSMSFVLELYGLFGVDATSLPFVRPDAVATAVSSPALFPFPGIVLRDGAVITAEVIRSTQPVTVRWVDAPTAGIEVTPSTSYRGTIGVQVLLTDGITATRVDVYQWAGLPIPTGVVWAPNPPPVEIEPGGTGYFDLSGSYAPLQSECEIRVTAEPDVVLAVDPPSLRGVAFAPIGIQVRDDDFVGLLTVSYDISCRTPDQQRSSVEYDLLLYVGIPIPHELAATGPQQNVLLVGAAALGLIATGVVLAGRRSLQRR